MSTKETKEEVKSSLVSKDKESEDNLRTSKSKRPVRRSDLVAAGPLAINKAYYGLEGFVTRWCHLEQPNKMDKMSKLGYELVHDPKTGEPVYKMARVGNELRKSFLMKTPEELYRQGTREKEEIVQQNLGRLEHPDESLGQYLVESNLRYTE